MTRTEATQAVGEYLRHTGGSELPQITNGVGLTETEARAALKALGAISRRSVNPWPSYGSIGGRRVGTFGELGGFGRSRFTVYSLGGAR